MKHLNLSFLILVLFISTGLEARQSKSSGSGKSQTGTANKASGGIQKNCKQGRGLKASNCQVTKTSSGDVLAANARAAGCRGHKGCDLARANKSQSPPPVYAVQGGTVIFAGWSGAYGRRVVIDHGGGHYTTYSHLENFNVKKGQKVSQRSPLGKMGTSGRSTGIHLHFEVVKGGKFVNPGRTYANLFCN